MQRFFFLVAFLLSGFFSYAQYTFNSEGYKRIDGKTKESSDLMSHRQVFSVSFPDDIFIHTILTDDGSAVTDSQIYKIIEVKKDENGNIFFSVESGVSGNKYVYMIKPDLEDPMFFMYSNGDLVQYQGSLTTLKTFAKSE